MIVLKIQTVFSRTTNIRQILVKTDLIRNNLPKGSNPCEKKCSTCKFMKAVKTFQSHTTKKSYTIQGSYNCKSKSIVYLISCLKCGKQYIGQTGNTLSERMYGHLADIKTRNEFKPVSRHFMEDNHDVTHINVNVI